MDTRLARTLPLALAALLLAGCSSSPSSTTPAPAGTSPAASSPAASSPAASSPAVASTGAGAGAAGSTMDISGFTFSTLTVKAGATVNVTNADTVAHTVNVNGTSIDVNVPGGGQASFTAPTKPGTYPLTCDFHRSMHGMLTVTA